MGNTGALPGAVNFGEGLFGGPVASAPAGYACSDLIYAGYRNAGILGMAGRGYSQEEVVDGLLVLNSLIDSLNAERLMSYSLQRTLFPLTLGARAYTIGPGATWNAVRPPKIPFAGVVLSADVDFELPVRVLTPAQWSLVVGKGIPDTLLRAIYYDRGVSVGTVYTWPVPSADGQIALYLYQLLSRIENTTDAVVLTYGYRRMLEWGLGIALAERFPTRAKLHQDAQKEFAAAKLAVQTLNADLEMQ